MKRQQPILLNYRARNQKHKRLFPGVCCLRIAGFPVSSSGTPVLEEVKEQEREHRRSSTWEKMWGYKNEVERAGESRTFPSKLWNLFSEQAARSPGKPAGCLSARLRNNCSPIRTSRIKSFYLFLVHFPSFFFSILLISIFFKYTLLCFYIIKWFGPNPRRKKGKKIFENLESYFFIYLFILYTRNIYETNVYLSSIF